MTMSLPTAKPQEVSHQHWARMCTFIRSRSLRSTKKINKKIKKWGLKFHWGSQLLHLRNSFFSLFVPMCRNQYGWLWIRQGVCRRLAHETYQITSQSEFRAFHVPSGVLPQSVVQLNLFLPPKFHRTIYSKNVYRTFFTDDACFPFGNLPAGFGAMLILHTIQCVKLNP